MKTLHRPAIFLVAVCFMLAACVQQTETPAPRITSDAELMDVSLITGEPCEPPCWQGITPGETTEEEAMAILRTLFFVDGDTIRVQGNTIYWHSDIENWPGGSVAIGDDGRVSYITYGLPYYLELQDLIDLRGEPDGFYAVTTRNADGGGPGGYLFGLLWLNDGFHVGIYTDVDDYASFCEISPFNPEMQVWFTSCFEPAPNIQKYAEREGNAWMISLIEEGYYHEWNDYQPIDCEP